MSAHKIINRLKGVERVGVGQWRASCPTRLHPRGDRSRGMYIRKVDDRLLVHCFAGCSAAEILDALGLSLGDLFAHPRESRHSVHVAQRWDYRSLLLSLEWDAQFTAMMADLMANGGQLNDLGREQLVKSAARISKVAEISGNE